MILTKRRREVYFVWVGVPQFIFSAFQPCHSQRDVGMELISRRPALNYDTNSVYAQLLKNCNAKSEKAKMKPDRVGVSNSQTAHPEIIEN